MPGTFLTFLRDHVPGFRRIERLPRQLLGASPFAGDIQPARVRLFSPKSSRPTLPFPHPWNYRQPLRILDTYFWDADAERGSGKHNCYFEVPGFAPILVTRDPRIIRAIATETGDRPGQFDRDPLPSIGIARATGVDTLLYANGPIWKRQKKLSAPPFARATLFQPEQFHEFAETFRHTVAHRLDAIKELLVHTKPPVRVKLEPEIKAIMLEMLANNFFGARISYEEIRNRYVPALERVIDHIVRDTVINKLGIPIRKLPPLTRKIAEIQDAYAAFEQLTTWSSPREKRAKAYGINSGPTRPMRRCATISRFSSPAHWKQLHLMQAGPYHISQEIFPLRRRCFTKLKTLKTTRQNNSQPPSISVRY